MSILPKAYKVCRIKIKKHKESKTNETNLSNISEQVNITNFENINDIEEIENKKESVVTKKKSSILESKLNNSNLELSNISLLIEPTISTTTNYNEHYITITLCYNFKTTDSKIEADQIYL